MHHLKVLVGISGTRLQLVELCSHIELASRVSSINHLLLGTCSLC